MSWEPDGGKGDALTLPTGRLSLYWCDYDGDEDEDEDNGDYDDDWTAHVYMCLCFNITFKYVCAGLCVCIAFAL